MKGDEVPEKVPLSPGRYLVQAESENDGIVRVPVIIAYGQVKPNEKDKPRAGSMASTLKLPRQGAVRVMQASRTAPGGAIMDRHKRGTRRMSDFARQIFHFRSFYL